jgi:hypothetical protein
MQGTNNIKLTSAQRGSEIYQYKNIRVKLYKTNAAIRFKRMRRQFPITPNYICIKVNGSTRYCRNNFMYFVGLLA